MTGTPRIRNDGHPLTARPFSCASRSSSLSKPAFPLLRGLWADFWLAGVTRQNNVVSGTHFSNLTPKPQACCSTWSRAHSASDAASMTRRRHTGSGSYEHNKTIDLPPVPPAARTLGDAETCPGPFDQGLGARTVSPQVPNPRGHTALRLQGGNHVRHHRSPPWRGLFGCLRGRLMRPLCI